MLHLQYSLQASPRLKHSQYFFWQPVFLQLHPLIEDTLPPKGTEALIIISSIAFARTSLNYCVFWQHSQLQSLQKEPTLNGHYLAKSTSSTALGTSISCSCTWWDFGGWCPRWRERICDHGALCSFFRSLECCRCG